MLAVGEQGCFSGCAAFPYSSVSSTTVVEKSPNPLEPHRFRQEHVALVGQCFCAGDCWEFSH